MAPDKSVAVEVVVAMPDRQELVCLSLPAGATAADALEQSLLQRVFPDIDLATCEISVWGGRAERSAELRDGDRVEVLRPLEIEPREARRELAKAGQFMGGPGVDQPG